MADTNSMLLLCSPGKGFPMPSVKVLFSEEFNMKTHSLHKNIEQVWQNKKMECSNLFNASKFRLHHIKIMETENSFHRTLFLSVGLTSYKEFIGTNAAPYADKLSQDGSRECENSQIYMADPIGVGGLVVTVDNEVIFMRRSKNCAEMALLVDRPGGHPEPDAITFKTGQDNNSSSEVVKEIFESVLKEIRDEINIPLEHLSLPILLGIGYNPDTWKRPSIEFFVRCSLRSNEVRKLYQLQTQIESEESTELIVLPLKEIIENDITQMKLYNELTHPAKSALYFLKIFMSK